MHTAYPCADPAVRFCFVHPCFFCHVPNYLSQFYLLHLSHLIAEMGVLLQVAFVAQPVLLETHPRQDLLCAG